MRVIDDNIVRLRELFRRASSQVNLRGILGITRYRHVYDSLMPVQRNRLMEIAGDRHDEFIERGHLISFAYVYPDNIVDNIGLSENGVFDKEAWNIYAGWYTYLNESLDVTAEKIAESFNGVPIKATTSGMAQHVTRAYQYFSTVVSHRVHAELAGIGWRGKNGLIVNPVYGCMIRLSGVLSSEPLLETQGTAEGCGGCESCLEACTFLKYRDRLSDYRDQCLVYMNSLGLDDEVCGKCVKACVYSPRISGSGVPPVEFLANDVYYTMP